MAVRVDRGIPFLINDLNQLVGYLDDDLKEVGLDGVALNPDVGPFPASLSIDGPKLNVGGEAATPEQKAEVLASLNGNNRGTWTTATDYLTSGAGGVRDTFTKDGVSYVVLADHTSGVFATDLAAGKFINNATAQLIIDLNGDSGSGIVGYRRDSLDATLRTVESKSLESFSVCDFFSTSEFSDSRLQTPTLDYTAVLQKAIDRCPDNFALMFNGHFRVSDALNVTDRVGLRLICEYGSITSTVIGKNIFRVTGGADVRISGFNAIGPTGAATTGAGTKSKFVYSTDSENLKIVGNKVLRLSVGRDEDCPMIEYSGNFGDSGYDPETDPLFTSALVDTAALSYGIFSRGSSGLHVFGNVLKAFLTDGVKLASYAAGPVYGEHQRVHGNYIYDCRNQDGIDCFDGGSGVSIIGNTISRCQKGINAKRGDSGTGNEQVLVKDILISGNVIDGEHSFNAVSIDGDQIGIRVNANGVIVNGNIIRGITGTGVTISDFSNGTIVSNNSISDVLIGSESSSGCGIFIANGSRQTLVENNVIKDCAKYHFSSETDDFSVSGGFLLAESVTPDRMAFINPASSGERVSGFRFKNVSMRNATGSSVNFGLRVSATLLARSVVDDCRMIGTFGTIFRDDTAGLVKLNNNSFQGSGISADAGNSSTVLTLASQPIVRYATAITANRSVTLPVTFIHIGARFRVLRESTATGAFSVNITPSGGSVLKALSSAGSWAEVEWSGSAWVLVGVGTL